MEISAADEQGAEGEARGESRGQEGAGGKEVKGSPSQQTLSPTHHVRESKPGGSLGRVVFYTWCEIGEHFSEFGASVWNGGFWRQRDKCLWRLFIG